MCSTKGPSLQFQSRHSSQYFLKEIYRIYGQALVLFKKSAQNSPLGAGMLVVVEEVVVVTAK